MGFMVETNDLTRTFKGQKAVDRVSLHVPEGSVYGLLGPNGAGKSTLLRLLNGLVFPEIGCYRFEGEEITARRLREHRYAKWFHQRVGFVWQNPAAQLFCASVREELAFGPEQMGLPADEVRRHVDDALSLCGIAHLAERAPYTLSGGEQKRTAIAAILTMNPAVWTLDEPLASLDEAGAAWLTDFLRALKRAGKTVIFSTHDTALADALAGVRWQFTPAREVRVER